MDNRQSPKEPRTDAPADPDIDKTLVVSKNSPLRHRLASSTSESPQVVSPEQAITLLIRGMSKRLALTENQEIILGRADPDERIYPGVDLTPFGAREYGVSRKHLRLTLFQRQVIATDLGGGNGTFLAGKLMFPLLPYPVHSGDDLVLGRLPVQIVFT
jgi:pSer/pThr/pTyr-binding forkhead associated (FHA) protein